MGKLLNFPKKKKPRGWVDNGNGTAAITMDSHPHLPDDPFMEFLRNPWGLGMENPLKRLEKPDVE